MPSVVRRAALLSVLLRAGVAGADPVPAPPTDSAPLASPAPAAPPTDSAPPAPAVPPAPLQQAVALAGPEAPYWAPVPVWIIGEGNEALSVAIYPDWAIPGGVPPPARCVTPCSLMLWRGRYRVAVAETPDTFAGNRVIEVEGPTRFVLTPRDRGKRTLGLVLGVGGSVLLVAGVLVAVHGSEVADRPGCIGAEACSSRWTPELTTGLLLVLGGLAATPIGWVMFGKSFRPGVQLDRGAAGSAVAPRLSVIAMPGGAGLGGRVDF
jgi:hypothetical protein